VLLTKFKGSEQIFVSNLISSIPFPARHLPSGACTGMFHSEPQLDIIFHIFIPLSHYCDVSRPHHPLEDISAHFDP
jgi:hypothetical protein